MKPSKRSRVLPLVMVLVLLTLSIPGIVWARGQLLLANAPVGQLLPAVLIVGHEAGRRVTSARQAIAAGADAVEVDVVAWHGQLYVSHNLLFSRRMPAAPTLDQLWPVDAQARVIEFDVKDSSSKARRLLIAFVTAHQRPGGPQLFISCRDLVTLQAFQQTAPSVFRFLSISSRHSLDRLRSDRSLRSLIDGISIRDDLITGETVRWLHQHGLLVVVWTVDDSILAQSLLQLGVDGITTDQPGIMTALSWLERGETHHLQRLAVR